MLFTGTMTPSHRQHNRTVVAQRGRAVLFVQGLDAIERYVDVYQRDDISKVGTDGVLGPALTGILRGMNTLLNGETDGLDAGKVQSELVRVANKAGIRLLD